MIQSLVDDLRFACQSLWFHRGQTLITILLLALGIGGATAVYTVANGVLIRPLPYSSPEELLSLQSVNQKVSSNPLGLSYPDYCDLAARNHVFNFMGAYAPDATYVRFADDRIRFNSCSITATLFQGLGIKPALGRFFLATDKKDNPVVIVSNRFWKSRLGGDKTAIGKTLHILWLEYSVVGVLPEDFYFPTDADLFFPMDPTPSVWTPRDRRAYNAIARVKPNVSNGAVQADLESISQRLAEENPATNSGWQLRAQSLHRAIVGDTRSPLVLLISAAIGLLLTAGANVAGMMLVAAIKQRREIALHGAMGATTSRILQQLFLKGLVTCVLAGILGVVLAIWGKAALISLLPDGLPLVDQICFDWRVMSFAVAMALVTGAIAGLSPAMFSGKLNISQTLREGGTASSFSLGTLRIRSLFVVAQIAIALALLSGMLTIMFHLSDLLGRDIGFDSHNVVALQTEFNFFKRGQGVAAYTSVLQDLRKIPGVKSASAISYFQLGLPKDRQEEKAEIEAPGNGGSSPAGEDAAMRFIDSSFFKTMGIRLLKGRYFQESDKGDGTKASAAVIINNALARKHWPQENPVGKQITVTTFKKYRLQCHIVGVVSDIRGGGYFVDPTPTVYFHNTLFLGAQLFLRTDIKPESLFAAIRKTIQASQWKEDISIVRTSTLEALLDESLSGSKLASVIMAFFAGTSLMLAIIGVYSILAYSSAFRAREMAIRQSLGATPGDIFLLIFGEACRISAAGGVTGILLSVWIISIIRAHLPGMDERIWLRVLLPSIITCLLFALASIKPAYDASRIPASSALRED